MSTVQEIESAIEKLPPTQLSQLSQWFDEYREREWDARMEADAKAGKFTRFKDEIAQARANGELIDFPLKSTCLRSFWDAYNALPDSVQKNAEKNYLIWKQNPSHPSLRFKPIGDGFWSLRVGIHYRAVGLPEGDKITWVWIGHHSEYDKL